MKRFMQRRGIAFLAILFFPVAACAQSSARDAAALVPDAVDPALWLVADEDTTIYMFGSFHLLPGDIDWFRGDVRQAFDSADELVVETLPPADGGAAIVQQLAAAQDGISLSDRLGAEQAARLAEAFAGVGIPLANYQAKDPWFAVLTLSVLEYRRLGMNPEQGVEMTLMNAAEESGKSVGNLESFEEQMHFFEDMPMDQQVAMLGDTLDQLATIGDEIGELVGNWATGRVEAFAAQINEGFVDDPALRAVLLVNRNRNWAAWIDQRLEEPGTVFLAVGAGHLAGEGSVQSFLAQRHIDTRRLD